MGPAKELPEFLGEKLEGLEIFFEVVFCAVTGALIVPSLIGEAEVLGLYSITRVSSVQCSFEKSPNGLFVEFQARAWPRVWPDRKGKMTAGLCGLVDLIADLDNAREHIENFNAYS